MNPPIPRPGTDPLPAARAALAEAPGFEAALQLDRQALDGWPCLSPSDYVDRDVLDFGCGVGAASFLFVERGARTVVGLDPGLSPDQIARLSLLPRARFLATPLTTAALAGLRFDLAYARFVTEHVLDLPDALHALHDALRPGGALVAIHDNYFGPLGAHDQAFVEPDTQPDLLRIRAPRCWESRAKCETSREFRDRVARESDWTVGRFVLTPERCADCPYFQRAQLWGHLLFQDSFSNGFGGSFYQTGGGGGLNKITPFQLRQFLVEAGFRITDWRPARLSNVPPPELIERFTLQDLTTHTLLFRAERFKS